MAEQLKGRTVFITGSGGVLGSTYVRRMLAEGARVIASDLPGQRAEALVEAHGGNEAFRFYPLDVANEDEVRDIFQRILKDDGGCVGHHWKISSITGIVIAARIASSRPMRSP